MILKKIEIKQPQKLSKMISNELGLGFNQIQKIIRNKDVKIDGKRVSKDVNLIPGNLVEIYFEEKPLKVIFENQDLIVVFKPRNIETVSENLNDDLLHKLSNQLGKKIFAVHRLDRNTSGLVVFAKNEKAKDSLGFAIKNRELKKFYLAKVVGVPEKLEDKLVAFLKKDEKKAQVEISDKKQTGFDEIRTNYKTLKKIDGFSVLEVELVTGKTHQIRAHLAHIGCPILGDEKYGDSEINRINKKRYQCLCAYKLIFNFSEDDYLSYLNGLVVELEKTEIDFL